MQIEPTGSVVEVKGINIDRVADGRIVEHWGEADTIGMLVQMGVDPFAGRIIGGRSRLGEDRLGPTAEEPQREPNGGSWHEADLGRTSTIEG
jgi:hypothetical protein